MTRAVANDQHQHVPTTGGHPGESTAHVRGGPPILDIGGNIGALVAILDADAAGTELHLRSEHRPPIAIHTGVWQRSINGTTITAAVFAELVEGTYWVLDANGSPIRQVSIGGAQVADIDLRTETANPQ